MPSAPSSPSFGRTTGVESSWKKELVAITLAPGQDAATVAADHGTTLNGNSWRVAGLDVPPGRLANDVVAELALDPRVVSAELDTQVETAETRQKSWAFDDGLGSPIACATQPATTSCGLQQALQVSRGQGILVAVLDTGAELTHPMLQGHVAGGIDFVDGDTDPSEGSYGVDMDGDGLVDEARGHGTHVAGVVSVVAPDAQLLIVRVLDSEGRGSMMNVARGIRWAVANGANVVNLSLGGLNKSDAVELALSEASAAGVACIAAAGNDGGPIPAGIPGQLAQRHGGGRDRRQRRAGAVQLLRGLRRYLRARRERSQRLHRRRLCAVERHLDVRAVGEWRRRAGAGGASRHHRQAGGWSVECRGSQHLEDEQRYPERTRRRCARSWCGAEAGARHPRTAPTPGQS